MHFLDGSLYSGNSLIFPLYHQFSELHNLLVMTIIQWQIANIDQPKMSICRSTDFFYTRQIILRIVEY